MAEKKKPETVEEIINYYQEHHHKKGKPFKERIKRFEEFFDPESIHAKKLVHHADYVVFGKPTDTKNFPGAYNEAYKVLDKHIKEDHEKLEDVDKLTEILETYVDSFLEKAMGEKFKETVSHAEKEGIKKEDIRKVKAQLFQQYHRDEEGNPIDVLDEKYIKKLKGKKKIELVERLRDVAERTKKTYSIHLTSKALEGVIDEDDRLEMAKYVKPIFGKKGFTHKDHPLTKYAKQLEQEYSLLLQGAGEQLQKHGYKVKKEEKES